MNCPKSVFAKLSIMYVLVFDVPVECIQEGVGLFVKDFDVLFD